MQRINETWFLFRFCETKTLVEIIPFRGLTIQNQGINDSNFVARLDYPLQGI